MCDGRWAGLRLGNLEMGGHRCEKSILCDLQSRAIVGGDNGRTNNQCIVKSAFLLSFDFYTSDARILSMDNCLVKRS